MAFEVAMFGVKIPLCVVDKSSVAGYVDVTFVERRHRLGHFLLHLIVALEAIDIFRHILRIMFGKPNQFGGWQT